ncbi:MAG: hypothetical protein LBU85_08745 [Treponema sp.]|jgi:hypothetical protein|nr:hypothetical protein [Treponema sp.]
MNREITPVKISRSLAVCIVLVSVLFIISCGELSSSADVKSFDNVLHGTWKSNGESSVYSGTLKIDFDTITIDGYWEKQTPLENGNDNERPFRGYPKRVPLKGYSEEGKIFIDYGGAVNGIPYIYTETGAYPPKYKLLEFTFGGREEILQMDLLRVSGAPPDQQNKYHDKPANRKKARHALPHNVKGRE